jgi:hypothetical protein
MFIETVGDLPLKDLKTRFEYLKKLFKRRDDMDTDNSAELQTGMGGIS